MLCRCAVPGDVGNGAAEHGLPRTLPIFRRASARSRLVAVTGFPEAVAAIAANPSVGTLRVTGFGPSRSYLEVSEAVECQRSRRSSRELQRGPGKSNRTRGDRVGPL